MSMNGREVVLVSGVRTAIGEFLGALAPLTAPQLGAVVIEEVVRRAGIEPSELDEVIMGNVVSGGIGQAPARQAALAGGIPAEVPVMTINKVCGSGLKAVMLGAQAIALGDAEIVVAGGLESMSQVPYYLFKARTGLRMGNAELIDGVIHDGLWCAFEDKHMGMAAEFTAERSGITREQQDEYAYNSHRKALAAIAEGKFREEIVPVEIPQRKGEPIVFDTDERPRKDIAVEKLAKLKPAFKKDGTVTAGNAPGLNDGAAALVVMSREMADKKKIKPMATITGYSAAGTEPKMLFYAPIYAVRKLMEKTGKTIDDYDIIELNEAFSAQALADGKELGWDWDRVNIHGGAVALGHPIGASGARVLVTLLYALKDRKKKTGLAALCLGGGHAVALSVEMQ
jgi:acetyl-CoA C-acetyltransferase